jgi:hypothetical protein
MAGHGQNCRITYASNSFGSSPESVTDKHTGTEFLTLNFNSNDATSDTSGSMSMKPIDRKLNDVVQVKFENLTLLNAFYPYAGYGALTWMVDDLTGPGVTTDFTLDISEKVYTLDNLAILQQDMNEVVRTECVAAGIVLDANMPLITIAFENGVIKFFTQVKPMYFESVGTDFAGRWIGMKSNGDSPITWGVQPDAPGSATPWNTNTNARKAQNRYGIAAYDYLTYSNCAPMLGGWPYVIVTSSSHMTRSEKKVSSGKIVGNIMARLPIDSSRYGMTTTFTKEFWNEIFLKQDVQYCDLSFWRPDGVKYVPSNTYDLLSFGMRTWYCGSEY